MVGVAYACLAMFGFAHAFPPLDIAAKIGVSLGIGLLVGLEREWAHKDLGVRTFGISALLGMLSSLVGVPFALLSMVGVMVIVVYVNWRTMVAQSALEATTSIALLVTFVLGVLTGQGHVFTPVASSIVLTITIREAPLASTTAAVVNALKTSITATAPDACLAPSSRLPTKISIPSSIGR